jgi:hypothetical protein
VSSDRFLRLLVKAERAKKHIQDLHVRTAAFCNTNPYPVIPEDDPQTGDRVFRVRKVAEVPTEITAIIGDVIHNFRSALDHLVYQLVLTNGGTPKHLKTCCYPIFDSREQYLGDAPAKLKGMDRAAIHFIDSTKPYKGGDDDLWRLHRLDIVDKHRLLIPVGLVYRTIVLDFTAMRRHAIPNSPDVQLPVIALPTSSPCVVVDGAEIHRVPRFAECPDMHTQPEFPPGIAVNEPEIGPAQPVLDMLQTFSETVNAIIHQFRRFL